MFTSLYLAKGDHGFTVVIDGDLICDALCPDEALGTVAAALYSQKRPPYVPNKSNRRSRPSTG